MIDGYGFGYVPQMMNFQSNALAQPQTNSLAQPAPNALSLMGGPSNNFTEHSFEKTLADLSPQQANVGYQAARGVGTYMDVMNPLAPAISTVNTATSTINSLADLLGLNVSIPQIPSFYDMFEMEAFNSLAQSVGRDAANRSASDIAGMLDGLGGGGGDGSFGGATGMSENSGGMGGPGAGPSGHDDSTEGIA